MPISVPTRFSAPLAAFSLFGFSFKFECKFKCPHAAGRDHVGAPRVGVGKVPGVETLRKAGGARARVRWPRLSAMAATTQNAQRDDGVIFASATQIFVFC